MAREAPQVEREVCSIAVSIERAFDQGVAAKYLHHIAGLALSLDLRAIEAAVSVLRRARDEGASVFILGNGGSAATASHLAADLANAPRRAGQPAMRVFSLAENAACLTALANDEGYDGVFASQLESFARPGDVVVAISASGNSPNVLRAVEVAHRRGATAVALAGFDGGELFRLADYAVLVPTPAGAYGPVEDLHLMLGHVFTACLCNA